MCRIVRVAANVSSNSPEMMRKHNTFWNNCASAKKTEEEGIKAEMERGR